jgi:CheY-like chemotaxis protein
MAGQHGTSIKRLVEAAHTMRPVNRLLVVDDDQTQRMLLTRLLSAAGYVVDEAANGDEALDLASENEYSLALLDYQMPGLNGVSLFAELHRRQPWIKGLLITAYGSLHTVYPAISAGIEHVLSKPVEVRDLLGHVRSSLPNFDA